MKYNGFFRFTKEKTIYFPTNKFLIYLNDNSDQFEKMSLKTEKESLYQYKKINHNSMKIFYKNSFSLDTTFLIDELHNTIKITFELNKSVKIVFMTYIFFGFFLETLLLYFHLVSKVELMAILIPILLIIFAATMLHVGFSLSAKFTLAQLEKTIKNL